MTPESGVDDASAGSPHADVFVRELLPPLLLLLLLPVLDSLPEFSMRYSVMKCLKNSYTDQQMAVDGMWNSMRACIPAQNPGTPCTACVRTR